MKTQKGYIAATAFVLAIWTLVNVPASLAQSSGMRAQIPFDFYVGDKLMPAGTYYAATTSSGSAIKIANWKGNSVFVMGMAATNRDLRKEGRFIFHRYNNVNFLSELQWQGFDRGRVLRTSGAELQASKSTRPVAVEVPIAPKNK